MRNTFNRRCVDAGRRRLSWLVGIALFGAFGLIGVRHRLAAADAPPHVVSMENMKFSPDVLRVRVGDRIEFRNADLVPHTATAKGSEAFDSGLIKPGETWSFVPARAGKFDYSCTFHPPMLGTVIVEPSRAEH